MKSQFKFIFIFLITCLFFLLVSCKNMYKVSNKDVKKIHSLVEELNVFEDDVPYLTKYNTITASVVEENYVMKLPLFEEQKLVTYEFKRKENILYIDNEIIEENLSISSLDDFAKKVVSIYDPTSYCISINEFVSFIKEIFLNTNEFKHSTARGGQKYYSCNFKGSLILDNEKIFTIINKLNTEIEIQDDTDLKMSLLFATDFSKIYPKFSISVNNQYIVLI